MPDDYPRSAYSASNVAPGVAAYDRLLRRYDLDDPQPNPPSIAQLMKKHGIEDWQINKGLAALEGIERAKITELLKLIKSESDVIDLVKAHIHRGNKKVPENYLIFNMTSAHECPSLKNASGHRFDYYRDRLPSSSKSTCQAFNSKGKLVCYAWRDEVTYPGAFPYRTRQNQLWESLIKRHPGIMTDVIRSYRKTGQIVAFRFSECGDFPDQASVNAVNAIARDCRRFSVPERITTNLYGKDGKISRKRTWNWEPGRFVVYCYTARRDLRFTGALDSGLVVMGSDWVDPKRGVVGTFKMVPSKDDPPYPYDTPLGRQWMMCPMRCRVCQRCVLGLSSRVKNH